MAGLEPHLVETGVGVPCSLANHDLIKARIRWHRRDLALLRHAEIFSMGAEDIGGHSENAFARLERRDVCTNSLNPYRRSPCRASCISV